MTLDAIRIRKFVKISQDKYIHVFSESNSYNKSIVKYYILCLHAFVKLGPFIRIRIIEVFLQSVRDDWSYLTDKRFYYCIHSIVLH